MTAFVYGVGSSRYAKQPHLSAGDLIADAVLEAFSDAAVDTVDAVWVGTVFGATGVAQRALHRVGVTDVPVITVENACASGTTALHEARAAVLAGRYERVLVVGVETMTAEFHGAIHPEETDAEGRQGLAFPGLYALAAARYLHEGYVTPEQLAQVAVKNHRHGLENPRAQYGGEITVEEVLGSRLIADPLTLLQCCPISDAAAAAILGPERGQARDVAIKASAMRSGGLWDQRSPSVWGFDLVRETAQQAFAEADLGPEDVDVFEVHDAFTIGEIVTTEALGLAEVGGGGALVASGATSIGGATPVNPSGGLLARGHPLGCTGVAQTAEIVWQLRGEAGGRQVVDARLGVVETMGGGVSGIDGNACVVAVLGE